MNADVVREMREKAHAIAVERHKKWWEGMTPDEQRRARLAIQNAEIDQAEHLAEFKPGVIELDPKSPPTPYAVQLQLLMLDVFVSLDELAKQPPEELEAAALWAVTVTLEASDNDVIIAPRPEWLPARDHANAGDLCRADIDAHGGENEAQRVYDAEWHTDELGGDPAAVVEERNEPEWAQRLRAIADVLIEVCPEDMAAEGEWLRGWLDAGAPMIDPAEPVQYQGDTRVAVEISETENTDGNERRAFNYNPPLPGPAFNFDGTRAE